MAKCVFDLQFQGCQTLVCTFHRTKLK